MSTNKPDIIAGYKGIMDLDLTDVREDLKKEITIQHQKDIDDYKTEQFKLKPHLRYENTIERIQKTHEKDEKFLKKRTEEHMNKETERVEMYNQKRDYIK